MKRILIADDSATARSIIRRCLDIAGCPAAHILEAATGQQALDLLRQHPVDLFVTDLVMPEMDGREVLARMAASPRLIAIPVIVVTSLTEASIDAERQALEACVVLPKPVTPPMLAEALQQVWSIWHLLGTALHPPRFDEAIDHAVTRTFEEMVFCEATRCAEEDLPTSFDDWPYARVRVREPAGGRFTLACPRDTLASFAALLTGEETVDITEDDLVDTLAELANVTAGRTLADYLPAGTSYLLGVPITGRGLAEPTPPPCVLHYMLNGTALVRLTCEPDAGEDA